MKKPDAYGMTSRPPPLAAQQPPSACGPHTGAVVTKLPIADLSLPDCGAWNGRVKWNQSSVAQVAGEPVIRAFYKKGSGTSAHPFREASGMSVSCNARGLVGTRGAVVGFDVFFDPASWHWSAGGKLGGLFVGDGKASGGRHSATGASYRIMWQADGGAISYFYLPKGVAQPNPQLQGSRDFGLGLHHATFAGALKAGQWNRVQIGVKLNSFAADGKPAGDGRAMLWVNGASAVTNNVNWSARPDMLLSGFEYSTFFGGPDPAVVDSVSYVRNFEVREWRD